MRVLDVGCGPGGLTRTLAEIVGADRVAAVDPSEDDARACRLRVPGADVRDGAPEALPFDDSASAMPSRPAITGLSRAAAATSSSSSVPDIGEAKIDRPPLCGIAATRRGGLRRARPRRLASGITCIGGAAEGSVRRWLRSAPRVFAAVRDAAPQGWKRRPGARSD
jgi:SAM-dependent methyltransferase